MTTRISSVYTFAVQVFSSPAHGMPTRDSHVLIDEDASSDHTLPTTFVHNPNNPDPGQHCSPLSHEYNVRSVWCRSSMIYAYVHTWILFLTALKLRTIREQASDTFKAKSNNAKRVITLGTNCSE